MKTEMDAMKMDERQRIHWLLANRATLIVVGLCWLGLIATQLVRGDVPALLIALVPVFALVRFGFYKHYASRG